MKLIMTKNQPINGQFIAMWEFKGEIWSETRKWIGSKLYTYIDTCEENEKIEGALMDEWSKARGLKNLDVTYFQLKQTSKKYPCPKHPEYEPDCGYPTCAHASQCEANIPETDDTIDPIDITGTIRRLRNHNKWRRGDDTLTMSDPTQLGKDIEAICDYLETKRKQSK